MGFGLRASGFGLRASGFFFFFLFFFNTSEQTAFNPVRSLIPQGLPGTLMGRLRARASRDDVFHDVAVHIGEAEIPPLTSKREPFVIETEEMENRRVEIMNMDRLLGRVET